MDQIEPVSKNIKKIVEEITQNLQTKFDSLKRDLLNLKKRQQEQTRDFSLQNSALLAVFEESNRESQTLASRKILLKKSIDKEKFDLIKLEKENQGFQQQLEELENVSAGLKERKLEALEKHRLLTVKLQQLKGKALTKETEHKGSNELYKRFLGLEMVRIKDNVVKIIYKNLGSECYVILDFSSEETVTESLPDLNLEKLNYLFKEKKNFYEFVKCVRDQMKLKL